MYIVSEEKLFSDIMFSLFHFLHRAQGSTGVLPFGKPEWHVSTTESDKETVKMGKEEWERRGKREKREHGCEESEWVNKNVATGIIDNEREDPMFSMIVKDFHSVQEWCRWPGCHLLTFHAEKRFQLLLFSPKYITWKHFMVSCCAALEPPQISTPTRNLALVET